MWNARGAAGEQPTHNLLVLGSNPSGPTKCHQTIDSSAILSDLSSQEWLVLVPVVRKVVRKTSQPLRSAARSRAE